MDDRMYIRKRYELLAGVIDERCRRLLLGAEAECIGYGGVSEVSRQTGVSRRTFSEGVKDLLDPSRIPVGRVRRKGAGRKGSIETDP